MRDYIIIYNTTYTSYRLHNIFHNRGKLYISVVDTSYYDSFDVYSGR